MAKVVRDVRDATRVFLFSNSDFSTDTLSGVNISCPRISEQEEGPCENLFMDRDVDRIGTLYDASFFFPL